MTERNTPENSLRERAEDALRRLETTGSAGEIRILIRDLSARETELETENRELKLRARLLDASYDAILLRKTDGSIIWANEAASQLYGYSRDELAHVNLSDIVPPENRATFERNQRIIREKGSMQLETEQVKKDGSRVTVETRATLVKSESGDYILSVTRDITDRKQAEKEVQIHSLLLDAASDAIYIRPVSGRFTYANAAAVKMYGYNREELSRMETGDLIAPEERQAFADRSHILRERGEITAETVHRRKNGTKFPVEVHATVVKLPDGDYIVTVARDITARKKRLEALQKSEERFRTLIENIPVGITVNTMGGRAVQQNAAAMKMHGYDSIEEFNRVPAAELYADPEERKQFLAELEKGLARDFETKHKRKDGSVFWVSVTAIPQTGESGETQIIVISQDITKRKQAEEALRQSEAKFRTLVENAPVGIAIVTVDGHPIVRNRAIAEQSGYTEEELTRLPVVSRYYDPEDRTRFLELAKKGIVRNFETRLKRKDGSFYWGSLTAIPHKTEFGDSLITIIEDITERKLAERELRESEEKYRRIVETANEGIWISEPNGRTTFVNRQIADLLGYTREEIIGRMGPEFLAKGQEEALQAMGESLARGENARLEIRFRRRPPGSGEADGRDLWTLANVTPLFDQRGKHTSNLAMLTDITDRKRDEEELKQLPLKLVQAQENERRAIGRELHDQTGQYLTALKLLVARAKNLPPDKTGVALDEVYILITELMQQVRELSLRMRPPMIDELGLMASLIWQFERVEKMGVSVNFRHTGINNKKLPLDVSIAVFRIVQEAITNAARHAGVDTVDVTVRATRSRLYLKVQDRGRGFDMDNLVRGGSGGLSSMNERALLLGGTVNIDSQPGVGTTVSAEIPIPPRAETRRARKTGTEKV